MLSSSLKSVIKIVCLFKGQVQTSVPWRFLIDLEANEQKHKDEAEEVIARIQEDFGEEVQKTRKQSKMKRSSTRRFTSATFTRELMKSVKEKEALETQLQLDLDTNLLDDLKVGLGWREHSVFPSC